MLYLTHRPNGPLAEFVDQFWLYAGYRPPHRFERLLPSGTVEMVISLKSTTLRCYDPETLALRKSARGPLVSGLHSAFYAVDTEQQFDMIGVHFRPGGAGAVLGLPAGEIEDDDVPLEVVWGGVAEELNERLLEAATPQRRFTILENALARRVRPERRPHAVVRSALRHLEQWDAPIAVGEMAAGVGWSQRRFIRTFQDEVGIPPKIYGRIRRFQGALRRIQAGKSFDWAYLALDCGYYDQAHLIRDFRAFSGLTPGAYARLSDAALVSIPVGERHQICPLLEPTRAPRTPVLTG